MITSNVSNTKNKLSELLQKVQQGEEVTIIDRNRPVARLVPIHPDANSSHMARLIAAGVVAPPVRTDRTLPSLVENTGVSITDAMIAGREEERA